MSEMRFHARIRTLSLASTLLVVLSAANAAAPAHATTTLNSGVTDYCQNQCYDVLPPGEDGTLTAGQLIGPKPAFWNNQLGEYANLVDNYKGLSNQTLGSFFNNGPFGQVPPNQVDTTYNPGSRSDVEVIRDTNGIRHVYATTRSGGEFGAGYIGAEDRLWMMDLLRHLGRGELSGFAGGAASNRSLEQQFYQSGPYNESDLQAQLDELKASGPRGAQAVQDISDYCAGVNQFISELNAFKAPAQYFATGNREQPFTPTDVVAIGTVIGALFGAGGGNQVTSAVVKLAAEARYGVIQGDQVWQAFRMENDPEADMTLHSGQEFDSGGSPSNPTGVAMPDPGSLQPQQLVFDPTGSAVGGPGTVATKASTSGSAPASVIAAAAKHGAQAVANAEHADAKLKKAAPLFPNGVLPANLLSRPHGMSNALVVSGQYTDSGHPVAVFGPQAGYFEPQILMLEEIQAPGISARGASFVGLNFYVQLGRGLDYSWSATSAGQDIVDTYAVNLCNLDGTPATKASNAYMYNGTCTAMDQIEHDDAWNPEPLADPTPSGSYKLIAFRTKFGIVRERATIGGKPVAYTFLRSTYLHEADSSIGFQMLNDPSVVTGPAGFQKAAYNIGYTFNWFYVDSTHTAYYNSGVNPTRPAVDDPNLPMVADAAHQWLNWDPSTNTVANTPFNQHPNSIDQDYYVSWNNKIAKGYTFTGFGDGSIYRSNMLTNRIKNMIASGTKISETSLVQAMEDAAVTDLRGETLLPTLLNNINPNPSNTVLTNAVNELKTWLAHGTKRVETSAGSHVYADADAIRIMDAWWPLLVKEEFDPPAPEFEGLGDDLYNALVGALSVGQTPSSAADGQTHEGSSFQDGWWSYMDKDLRALAGQPVQGALPLKYCGNGDVATCRAEMASTLDAAAATPATTVYPGDSICGAGDAWCADSIVQHPLDGSSQPNTNWQNRPTFQQVVQFPSHRTGIANGGFEDGGDPNNLFYSGSLDGWIPVGPAARVPLSPPTTGRLSLSAAQLGSTQPTNGDSSIWQTFTVPATGINWLSFWYRNTCPDTVSYDWATATLRDNSNGMTTTPLAKTCVPNGAWTLVTSKVTPGDTYTVTLTNHDDNYPGDPTYTFYDDVSLAQYQPVSNVTIERDPLNNPAGQIYAVWPASAEAPGYSVTTLTINGSTTVPVSGNGNTSAVLTGLTPRL
jgi:acyl-homoserine lactone acylase PvdQ